MEHASWVYEKPTILSSIADPTMPEPSVAMNGPASQSEPLTYEKPELLEREAGPAPISPQMLPVIILVVDVAVIILDGVQFRAARRAAMGAKGRGPTLKVLGPGV